MRQTESATSIKRRCNQLDAICQSFPRAFTVAFSRFLFPVVKYSMFYMLFLLLYQVIALQLELRSLRRYGSIFLGDANRAWRVTTSLPQPV
jgi:hypothetical protein